MILQRFRRGDDGTRAAAEALYAAIAARAREPVFYLRFGVPDTLDGRFDLLALHAFLVMHALRQQGERGDAVGAALANRLFAGFEDALRELGVGDMGIARRIKAMANAFYGRLEVYGAAKDAPSLADALQRNLFRGTEGREAEARTIAHYMLSVSCTLEGAETAAALVAGCADFGPVPERLS